MKVPIHYVCVECDTPDPKIITLFVREHFCGRYCLAEGQVKFERLLRRAIATEVEHGLVV